MNKPDNQFSEFEEFDNFSNLDTNNLIIEYLKKPKLVYKYLFKINSEKYFWPLLIAAGAVNGLEKGLERITSFDGYGIGILLGALIIGAGLGWISYFISAWFLYLFGSAFLGGNATAKDFRVVIAWANIPSIATIFLTLLMYLLYGLKINSYEPDITEVEAYVIMGLSFIAVGLVIWSFILNVIGTMYIQNFGVGKAIANILLPTIILLVIIFIFFSTIFGF
jgi:hypothetical protein